MANTISKVREQRRQLKAEAKRRERAQRRVNKRAGAASASERVYAAPRRQQSTFQGGDLG